MKNQPIKAYIFDMDGTLVDNCAYHVASWQKFAKAHGKTISKKKILDWMGAQGSFYIEQIFGKAMPLDEVARLCAEKEAIYRKIYKPKLPDGLREWLDYAHARKIPCALATGGPRENVDFILDALGLRDDFAVIVDGSMYTHSKPDPECFLKAAALMGVEPPSCRVYEDAVNGIGAALATGMSVVAITFTNSREVLEDAGAHRVIDSYRELKIWPVKPERTPEDDAEIAYLDGLRSCTDEEPPVVPLACIVKVTDVENVPKAGERYAMATVEVTGSKTWRVCMLRETVEKGDDALFVTPDVALPNEDRFRKHFHVKERVYKYGFGVSERVLQLHLSRNIYRNNPGQLAPIKPFREPRPAMSDIAVMQALKLQPLSELWTRTQPKPASSAFRPAMTTTRATKNPMSFLDKVSRHRERFDEETRDR